MEAGKYTKKCSTMTKVTRQVHTCNPMPWLNSSSDIISLKLNLASKKFSALYPPTYSVYCFLVTILFVDFKPITNISVPTLEKKL